MNDVKSSRLYKTLKKAVRKEDHAELLRMLEMVPKHAYAGGGLCREGFGCKKLINAFYWIETPQGHAYWEELSDQLHEAGHDCY